MNAFIDGAVFESLQKLARFFVWSRKPLAQAVTLELHSAQARFDDLRQRHAQVSDERQQLETTRLALTQQLAEQQGDLEQVQQHLAGVQTELELLTQTHEHATARFQEESTRLKTQFTTLQQRHTVVIENCKQLEVQKLDLEQRLADTSQALDDLKQTLVQTREALATEQTAHQQVAGEYAELLQTHENTSTRYKLVSRLLSVKAPDNSGLLAFKRLLNDDYMKFAEAESSLAAEAQALMMLQSIEQELELLVGSPSIFKRNIVGIAGGFSSGKSEFINSFIQDKSIQLAVGLQPVTAIPSYVVAAPVTLIRGYSANGGSIELEADFYKSISHAFISSFGFDLKRLLPFMCIGVKMDLELLGNVCFIDTPGYNPGTAGEYTVADKGTALQFAQKSDALIWVIGLDANGTITDPDLDFIHDIGFENRPIYIVLNKADLKSADDIESVMNEVKGTLDMEGIPYVGISAYSSTKGREYAFINRSLHDFLKDANHSSTATEHLFARLEAIMKMYRDALQSDISQLEKNKGTFNSFKLDALEIGGAELYERMQDSLAEVEGSYDTSELKAFLQDLTRLQNEFKGAIELTVSEAQAVE